MTCLFHNQYELYHPEYDIKSVVNIIIDRYCNYCKFHDKQFVSLYLLFLWQMSMQCGNATPKGQGQRDEQFSSHKYKGN